MKKILAMLLALLMLLSLTACEEKERDNDWLEAVRGEISADKDKDDDDEDPTKGTTEPTTAPSTAPTSGSNGRPTAATTNEPTVGPTTQAPITTQPTGAPVTMPPVVTEATEPEDETPAWTEPTEQPMPVEPTTPSAGNEFDTGKINSNKYVNTFAGISCELGSEWTFMTEDEIRQNNEAALGLVGKDYAEAIKNASTFTDMMAKHSNQTDSVGVTFEKLPGAYASLTEDQYMAISKDSTKSALESMGISNVTVTTGKTAFAGNIHACMDISGQYYGVNMYQKMVVMKCGDYMVIVTVGTWKTNTCQAVLNSFKAI